MPAAKCLSCCVQIKMMLTAHAKTIEQRKERLYGTRGQSVRMKTWARVRNAEKHIYTHTQSFDIFLLKFSKWYDAIKQSHNTKQGYIYDVAQTY